MIKVVERERNKTYYRVLHVPIWIWAFFIVPGHLTYDLFTAGPDVRHAVWLAVVTGVCVWRGLLGRLPGVEPRPYITYWGADTPNLGYRVVCYTVAWIDLLVPHTLNAIGLAIASVSGEWMLRELFAELYYPLAALIVVGTIADVTPRTRSSTLEEGAERAWLYVAIWTIVPTQVIAWAAWRLGRLFELDPLALARLRLAAFVVVTAVFLTLGLKGILPRTRRVYARAGVGPGEPLGHPSNA